MGVTKSSHWRWADLGGRGGNSPNSPNRGPATLRDLKFSVKRVESGRHFKEALVVDKRKYNKMFDAGEAAGRAGLPAATDLRGADGQAWLDGHYFGKAQRERSAR